MNFLDCVLSVLLLAAVVGAIVWYRKGKKSGKGCCGSCAQCRKNCNKEEK